MSNARQTALSILVSCRTGGAWADAALKSKIQRDGLRGADAALCSRMVYGVLQNQLLLDFYIGAFCSQRPDHLQPPLLEILRLGAYQILFLDKVPDHAAVSESVELAKLSKRGQAAGLVNAVLRKLSQNKHSLPPIPDHEQLRYLSIRYSHPRWLVKRLLSAIGPEETEAFLQINNSVAPLTIQINPMKTTAAQLRQELTDAGISVLEHPWVPGCMELSATGDLTALPAFQNGEFFVQDPAASLVAQAAEIRPGQRVLDVCAAPGGKSFSAAIAMGDVGCVTACDLHESKLSRIREGCRRLDLSCVETVTADGRIFRPEWAHAFDTVLVDAPCSGLGIIRKKPDVRYKKADDLFALPVIQSAILENAARYVRPGGSLVYSTCTVLPEENEQITDAFLAEHPDFSREKMRLPQPLGDGEEQITLWPQRHQTDGFYICRMKRHP